MKSPGTFSAENQTLRNLIQEAYGVPSGQGTWLPFFVAPGKGMTIVGGPDWVEADRYDVIAKWDAVRLGESLTMQSIGQAQSEMNLMLRALLEERFQLRVHRETRDLPVYQMTITKPGKLRHGNCTTFDPGDSLAQESDYCGGSRLGRKGSDWTLDGRGMKMAQLADTLSFLIGSRTIIDKTG